MSAKLASKTKFYMDFKPLTFGPFLKKTLYIYITRRKVLKVAIERARIEKSIVNLRQLSISVDCQSQSIVDLSRLSISVNC